jgi:hypothetical protein
MNIRAWRALTKLTGKQRLGYLRQIRGAHATKKRHCRDARRTPRSNGLRRIPEPLPSPIKFGGMTHMENSVRNQPAIYTGNRTPLSSISLTLVTGLAYGVAAANIYYNRPMLGIMEAAFPGQAAITGMVPTATQLGFAVGLLLLVPLGDRIDSLFQTSERRPHSFREAMRLSVVKR